MFLNTIFKFSECQQTVPSIVVMLSDSTKFGECQSIGHAIWWVLLDSFSIK